MIPFFSDAELVPITIDLLVLTFAYRWFFPRVHAYDLGSLSRYDLITSLGSTAIAGVLFYNSGITFHLFGSDTNWFWFSLAWYLMLEIPFAIGYMRKHSML